MIGPFQFVGQNIPSEGKFRGKDPEGFWIKNRSCSFLSSATRPARNALLRAILRRTPPSKGTTLLTEESAALFWKLLTQNFYTTTGCYTEWRIY